MVLTIAARHGDRDLFDRMRAAAGKKTNERFRGNLIFCLGLFQDPEIIKVAHTHRAERMSSMFESRSAFFSALRKSAKTRDLGYDFVKAELGPAWSPSFPPYRRLRTVHCRRILRRRASQGCGSFFKAGQPNTRRGPRILAQVLEGIDLCVAYNEAQKPSVTEFLQRYGNTHR